MKKIVLAAVMLFIVFAGRTQTFEGSIKSTMKLDITDPKAKAEMEEAKKKANDPANQAKIKEMQARMNDPQFKAMMESNPQMKTQMEAMLKMMAGGDLSSMLPSAVIVKLKGTNSLVHIEGGIMDKTEILHQGDQNITYSINHPSKTYAISPEHTPDPKQAPKVTKTSESMKLLGYNCTKYIIETTTPDGKTMISNSWATTEIKDIDVKKLAKMQGVGKSSQSMFYEGIDGFPLRTQVTMPQGNLTIDVVEINRGVVPASDFVLPAGYTEAKK